LVKVKVEGEGLNIEKEVDEQTANTIIALIFGLKRARGRKPAGEGKKTRKKASSPQE